MEKKPDTPVPVEHGRVEQVNALAQAASASGSHGKLSVHHWHLLLDALHASGWKLGK